ncbi:hypothetical protein [Pelosinus sp. sgz500959]|uniref:hypothetical protein n=1 Tax=Pelosinus sp. sgz500959 TaxID=3242472 RepID=UPI00366AE2EB
MNKLKDMLIILALTGVFVVIANVIGYKGDVYDSLIGTVIMIAIALVGMMLSQFPGLNKMPMVFWISVIGVICSLPAVPGSQWIVASTKKVQFLAITTPILAYAGLSLGKDIEMFKKISWRVIPVALAVITGTFIFASAIAQVVLKMEGVI